MAFKFVFFSLSTKTISNENSNDSIGAQKMIYIGIFFLLPIHINWAMDLTNIKVSRFATSGVDSTNKNASYFE